MKKSCLIPPPKKREKEKKNYEIYILPHPPEWNSRPSPKLPKIQ